MYAAFSIMNMYCTAFLIPYGVFILFFDSFLLTKWIFHFMSISLPRVHLPNQQQTCEFTFLIFFISFAVGKNRKWKGEINWFWMQKMENLLLSSNMQFGVGAGVWDKFTWKVVNLIFVTKINVFFLYFYESAAE